MLQLLNMQKLVCVFIIFFALSSKIFANEFYKLTRRNVIVDYTVEEGDRFDTIIKQFVKLDSIINSRTPMVKYTLAANKHVKDWKNLKPGTEIKLYIGRTFLSRPRLSTYVTKMKKKATEGFHANIFYMASQGSFGQISESSNLNINYNQNSPATVGVSSIYFFPKTPYSLSTSFYLSNLTTPQTQDGQEVVLNNEIGLTAHAQYFLKQTRGNLYAGPEFESFDSFNSQSFAQQNRIVVNNTSAIYLTFGYSQLFHVWSQKVFAKLSYSTSLFTSTTVGEGGIEQVEPYSGSKVLLYLNFPVSKDWFMHALYKYHTMTGDDELTTTRIGFGIGFNLL